MIIIPISYLPEQANRIVKAATFEGRTPKRVVTPELIEFPRRFAAGGVGMTTVAYCAITRAGSESSII